MAERSRSPVLEFLEFSFRWNSPRLRSGNSSSNGRSQKSYALYHNFQFSIIHFQLICSLRGAKYSFAIARFVFSFWLCVEGFAFASQERRYEILEFLESIMEAGELADEIATRLIFKNSGLAGLLPQNTEKKD